MIGVNRAFDFEKFFTLCPMPEEYNNKDTKIQLLDMGFYDYAVIIANPNLPPMGWTGTKWEKIGHFDKDAG